MDRMDNSSTPAYYFKAPNMSHLWLCCWCRLDRWSPSADSPGLPTGSTWGACHCTTSQDILKIGQHRLDQLIYHRHVITMAIKKCAHMSKWRAIWRPRWKQIICKAPKLTSKILIDGYSSTVNSIRKSIASIIDYVNKQTDSLVFKFIKNTSLG